MAPPSAEPPAWRAPADNVGAVAFSRTGELELGGFGPAEVLHRYGETPDDLSGVVLICVRHTAGTRCRDLQLCGVA